MCVDRSVLLREKQTGDARERERERGKKGQIKIGGESWSCKSKQSSALQHAAYTRFLGKRERDVDFCNRS